MNEFEKLEAVDAFAVQVFIRNRQTGEEGVAGLANTPGHAAIWYGADDGSDDTVIPAEVFDRDWMVTKVIVAE